MYITKYKVGSHTYLNFDTFTRCAKHHIMILFLTSLDDHVYATAYYYLCTSKSNPKKKLYVHLSIFFSEFNALLGLSRSTGGPCFKLEN